MLHDLTVEQESANNVTRLLYMIVILYVFESQTTPLLFSPYHRI